VLVGGGVVHYMQGLFDGSFGRKGFCLGDRQNRMEGSGVMVKDAMAEN